MSLRDTQRDVTDPRLDAPLSGRALGRQAAGLYPEAPQLMRLLAMYRPRICPFDRLLDIVPRQSRVLDVGCGSGLFLGLLKLHGRVSEGVGFDPFEPAILTARAMASRFVDSSSGSGNLRFEQIGAQDAWPEGSFDVVSMIDVMHHLPVEMRRDAVRRSAERLCAGGIFLYKDMCRYPRWRRFMNRLHDLVLTRQVIREEPIEHVEAWAREAGLICEARDRINMLWYGHELRVFRRIGGEA